ncbi:hypothetical protein [Streptomyces sp. NPDC005407]|uniref:hypothetical protein n=1 Tax=Streptomyces sp. NPDC005407 TaxID=3155340 RepID=UPI0033B20754
MDHPQLERTAVSPRETAVAELSALTPSPRRYGFAGSARGRIPEQGGTAPLGHCEAEPPGREPSIL